MMGRRWATAGGLLAILMLWRCTACGKSPRAEDLLADIRQRGYILVSTDPNFKPQSFLDTEAKRPGHSKCPRDALTSAEMQGFDVDVAKAIGEGLGVETCFATPSWNMITAGNWAGKWDISVGSMTIIPARRLVLDFSLPYYRTPAMIAVLADSPIRTPENLDGQDLCVGTASTYADWLAGRLELPKEDVHAQPPRNVKVIPLETDQECAQALAAGRKDFVGYVTSGTVVDADIAAGIKVRIVGGPVFTESMAAAFDKASSLPTASLQADVDSIITKLHKDGRLTAMSMRWYGKDYTGAVE